MKILHYSTGFDTDKGGGITRYTTDLMKNQNINDKVILLYPGEYGLINKKIFIKYNRSKYGIDNFRIINPLPIPFLNGINTKDYNHINDVRELWEHFFIKIKPDIFHIHTLVGLPPQCIEVAKQMNIPLLYTTHDFFGICAKQTLFFNNMICSEVESCINCPKCNSMALSSRQTHFLHSKLYAKIRRTRFISIIKNRFKEMHVESNRLNHVEPIENFKDIRKKYLQVFSLIDYFHFNSSITEIYFRKYLGSDIRGKRIPITLENIKDNRKVHQLGNIIRLTYLGPPQNYKGFGFMINCLDQLYRDYSFVLNIFFSPGIKRSYFNFVSYGYTSSDLKDIFSNTDLLLVPSQCMETFGLIVAEAKSFGVPVMTSSFVGSKDIICNGDTGYIANNEDWGKILEQILKEPSILLKFNSNILNEKFYTMSEHAKDIGSIYKKLVHN